jgi:uncharacterized protein YbcI
MDEFDAPAPEHPGSALTEPDYSAGVELDPGERSKRSEISNAMVGLKKRYYGKGPEKAKTFINDCYVFCVLEGGLTRNEETLLEAGKETLVREYRLEFQAAMQKTTTEALAEITGREVLGYHSQITFYPPRSFEIFVLDGPPGG